MAELRLGLVGLNFGTQLLRTVVNLDGAKVAAIADSRAAHLPSLAQQYNANAYHDAAEMIAREPLDGVILATSPARRREVLVAAIEKNLPVFVEKPWAANMAQARELADLCRGAPVMVGFSFRYLPAIAKLRELLSSDLGQPLMLSGSYISSWLPPAESWLWDPAVGGGYFNENSCHLFDSVNSLLGRPVALHAQTRSCFDRPAADVALVTVRYQSSAIASLSVGGVGAGAFQDYPSLQLIATGGQATLGGRHHIWDSLAWASRSDAAVRRFDPPPEALGETRYSRALRAFFQCIREKTPSPSTIEDGVICVRMAEAIAESARLGKTVDL